MAAEPVKKGKKKKKGKDKDSPWAGEVKLQRNAYGVEVRSTQKVFERFCDDIMP